jgi:hypothetical protein
VAVGNATRTGKRLLRRNRDGRTGPPFKRGPVRSAASHPAPVGNAHD